MYNLPHRDRVWTACKLLRLYLYRLFVFIIQGDSVEKVNILGGDSIGNLGEK